MCSGFGHRNSISWATCAREILGKVSNTNHLKPAFEFFLLWMWMKMNKDDDVYDGKKDENDNWETVFNFDATYLKETNFGDDFNYE